MTNVDNDQNVGETRIAKIKLKIGWGQKSPDSVPEAQKSMELMEMEVPGQVPDLSLEVLAVGSGTEPDAPAIGYI